MSLFTPKKKRIFIVEDNEIYANTLAHYLKGVFGDIEVDVFPVGELCLTHMNKEPDIVILDHLLNSKYYDAENGFDVLRKIKEIHPQIKTLLVSSQGDIELAIKTIKELDSEYVIKNEDAFFNIREFISKQFR